MQNIHGKLAQRLAADYVLAALLLVQRQLSLDNQQLRGLSARWLEVLGLHGGSDLLEVRLEDGRNCLTLERKACCQHFRRGDGELCNTCPKLRRDERLLRLRELFYTDDNTLGQRAMTIMRQSDQAKFRSYRENTRWETDGVLFVTLNVPGDNNNYKTAGGRNGEYEDRLEANRQWLARAFAVAHQRKMAGVVVMMHADPLF